MKRFAIGLLVACVFLSCCSLVINGYTPINILPIDTPVDILPADEFSPKPIDINPKCDNTPGCCPTELTGRYHLRGRTQRFFGRVS